MKTIPDIGDLCVASKTEPEEYHIFLIIEKYQKDSDWIKCFSINSLSTQNIKIPWLKDNENNDPYERYIL